MTRNTESWFCLALPHERQIVFTEHLAYKWLDAPAAAALTKSWSNRQAIEQFVLTLPEQAGLSGDIFMAGHSKWAYTRHRKAAQDASAVKSSLKSFVSW